MITEAAYIHPSLLLSVSDHFNRVRILLDASSLEHQICGLILGKFNKENHSVSLLNSFDTEYTCLTSQDKLKTHIDLLSEIYGTGYLSLIGFYLIESENTEFDSNTIMSNLNETIGMDRNQSKSIIDTEYLDSLMLLRIKDLNNVNSIDKLHDYMILEPIIPKEDIDYSNIKYEMRLLKSEEIAVSSYKDSSRTIESNNRANHDISNSLQNITSNMQKAIQFLTKVENGEISTNKSQKVVDALNSLSYLSSKTLALNSSIKAMDQNSHETVTNHSFYSVSSVDKETYDQQMESELDKLIAYSSLCSSSLLENLSHNL